MAQNTPTNPQPGAEKDAACPVCGLDYLTECSCTRQPPPDAEKDAPTWSRLRCALHGLILSGGRNTWSGHETPPAGCFLTRCVWCSRCGQYRHAPGCVNATRDLPPAATE